MYHGNKRLDPITLACVCGYDDVVIEMCVCVGGEEPGRTVAHVWTRWFTVNQAWFTILKTWTSHHCHTLASAACVPNYSLGLDTINTGSGDANHVIPPGHLDIFWGGWSRHNYRECEGRNGASKTSKLVSDWELWTIFPTNVYPYGLCSFSHEDCDFCLYH